MFKTLLAAALLLSTTAFAEDVKLPRTLSIIGHGEVHATPDRALVNLGVASFAATAQEALAANTKSMNELMVTLKAAGIENKDIMTSNFSVNSRLDYGQNNGQPPKVTGYDVNNAVMVTVRKIEIIGDVLDKAVTSGSNQINGVTFSIADPQSAMDEARKEAVKDAKRKADLYAAAGGVTIGNLITLSENGGYQPQQPMMMQTKAMASDAGPVPIAQGEQVIAIDVSITWEIK
jgi:uncharacterized protein